MLQGCRGLSPTTQSTQPQIHLASVGGPCWPALAHDQAGPVMTSPTDQLDCLHHSNPAARLSLKNSRSMDTKIHRVVGFCSTGGPQKFHHPLPKSVSSSAIPSSRMSCGGCHIGRKIDIDLFEYGHGQAAYAVVCSLPVLLPSTRITVCNFHCVLSLMH